jgi:hypothetical protein
MKTILEKIGLVLFYGIVIVFLTGNLLPDVCTKIHRQFPPPLHMVR